MLRSILVFLGSILVFILFYSGLVLVSGNPLTFAGIEFGNNPGKWHNDPKNAYISTTADPPPAVVTIGTVVLNRVSH